MENKHTSNSILAEFPNLFDVDKFYGLQCNPGWFPLIHEMCKELAKVAKEDKLDKLSIVQIKEKFGGLRVYMHYGNHRTRAIYENAAQQAETTCEVCGSDQAKMTLRGGYYQTLCDPCYQIEQKRVGGDG